MRGIIKYKTLNKLKSVYRFNTVDNRKESTAEHSWGCLMLADYILNRTKIKVNRIKVYEMLMYHDIAEIISGDFALHPKINHKNKKEKEIAAAKKLKKILPKEISNKYWELIQEFEHQQTKDARFAKMIDQLEAEVHEIDYKEDWKGWTEEYLRTHKEKYFNEFPEVKKIFEELVLFFRKNGYFSL